MKRQQKPGGAKQRSATFDIASSRDFYAMLVADFDEYMIEPESSRRALHCAITAYHLRDWVWGDWLKADYEVWKFLKIHSQDDFYSWIYGDCPWFKTIEDLATGMKHFSRDQNFEASRVGAPPFMLDELGAGWGQGAWDGPIPYVAESHGKGHLLIDYGEGAGAHRWRTAAALLEVVVRFWRDFFRTHRPSADLPVSKHHLS
jgi:hypothetical protein